VAKSGKGVKTGKTLEKKGIQKEIGGGGKGWVWIAGMLQGGGPEMQGKGDKGMAIYSPLLGEMRNNIGKRGGRNLKKGKEETVSLGLTGKKENKKMRGWTTQGTELNSEKNEGKTKIGLIAEQKGRKGQ